MFFVVHRPILLLHSFHPTSFCLLEIIEANALVPNNSIQAVTRKRKKMPVKRRRQN